MSGKFKAKIGLADEFQVVFPQDPQEVVKSKVKLLHRVLIPILELKGIGSEEYDAFLTSRFTSDVISSDVSEKKKPLVFACDSHINNVPEKPEAGEYFKAYFHADKYLLQELARRKLIDESRLPELLEACENIASGQTHQKRLEAKTYLSTRSGLE